MFHSLDFLTPSDETTKCSLLQEQPPNMMDISKNVLHMIKTAQSKIRIIQPYVQNIDELED